MCTSPPAPLPEQRRIAAILDHADSLRAKRRQALDLLDTLTQSIFTDMFGDPIGNPKRWPAGKLGDVATLHWGWYPSPRSLEILPGGHLAGNFKASSPTCFGRLRSTSQGSHPAKRHEKLVPAGTLLIVVKSEGLLLAHQLPSRHHAGADLFRAGLEGMHHTQLRVKFSGQLPAVWPGMAPL